VAPARFGHGNRHSTVTVFLVDGGVLILQIATGFVYFN
jgi:hypothetical protein